jgi:hypothetical protein
MKFISTARCHSFVVVARNIFGGGPPALVTQNVDAAELLSHVLHKRLNCNFIGYIEYLGEHSALVAFTNLGRGGIELLLVA